LFYVNYEEDGMKLRRKIFYLSNNKNGQLTMTFNQYILQSYDD